MDMGLTSSSSRGKKRRPRRQKLIDSDRNLARVRHANVDFEQELIEEIKSASGPHLGETSRKQ
jgi:hypothetical protein